MQVHVADPGDMELLLLGQTKQEPPFPIISLYIPGGQAMKGRMTREHKW